LFEGVLVEVLPIFGFVADGFRAYCGEGGQFFEFDFFEKLTIRDTWGTIISSDRFSWDAFVGFGGKELREDIVEGEVLV
jgi:hypothetical protein